MDEIRLTVEEHAALKRASKNVKGPEPMRVLRADYLLLLDDGHPADYVAKVCFAELAEVEEAARLFREGGIAAIVGTG